MGGGGYEFLVSGNILLTCFLFSYNLFVTIYVLLLRYWCAMQAKFSFSSWSKGFRCVCGGGGGVKGIFVTRELRYLLGENSGGCFLSGEM